MAIISNRANDSIAHSVPENALDPRNYSSKSLDFLSFQPGVAAVERSDEIGWTSLLTGHSRGASKCTGYETGRTPDQRITVMTGGHGRIEYHEKGQWIGRTFSAGTIFLAEPEESQWIRWETSPKSPPVEWLHVFICKRLFEEAVEVFRRPGQRSHRPNMTALAIRDGVLERVMLALLRGMRDNLPDIYAQATAQWIVVHLLGRGGNLQPEQPAWAGGVVDLRLQRAIDYMQAHLSEEIELEKIAEAAAVSKFHFVRLFKAATGNTPFAHLTELRLNLASSLLRRGSDLVSQVAYQSGFKNITHFNAAFHKRFGVAPSAYRREFGKTTVYKRENALA
ncbi:helix-turn-helix domain-containing protein [Sphingomonas morindae]|uniref:Helix-turn-helix domain-containing protein n=1 Tax=Sphingomonas morindae TaxID=1541170 RepID=A0ABY4XB27_9SPHN|nr:helix-turn-helix domain-containing protein [Sphingomonas morindae]USI73910.1 helix-turn-helix domain-containing protein [Sphingomonas morindae]